MGARGARRWAPRLCPARPLPQLRGLFGGVPEEGGPLADDLLYRRRLSAKPATRHPLRAPAFAAIEPQLVDKRRRPRMAKAATSKRAAKDSEAAPAPPQTPNRERPSEPKPYQA